VRSLPHSKVACGEVRRTRCESASLFIRTAAAPGGLPREGEGRGPLVPAVRVWAVPERGPEEVRVLAHRIEVLVAQGGRGLQASTISDITRASYRVFSMSGTGYRTNRVHEGRVVHADDHLGDVRREAAAQVEVDRLRPSRGRVIKCPSPLKVLRDTHDHSCY
jgi:hypothetical protein